MKKLFKKAVSLITAMATIASISVPVFANDAIVSITPNGNKLTSAQTTSEISKVNSAKANAYSETDQITASDGKSITQDDINKYINTHNMSQAKINSIKKYESRIMKGSSLSVTSYYFVYDDNGVAIALSKEQKNSYDNNIKKSQANKSLLLISPLDTQHTSYNEWDVYAMSTMGNLESGYQSYRDYYFDGWVDFHFNNVSVFCNLPDYIGLAWSGNQITEESTENCYSYFIDPLDSHNVIVKYGQRGKADSNGIIYQVYSDGSPEPAAYTIVPDSYDFWLTTRQTDTHPLTLCALTTTFVYTYLNIVPIYSKDDLTWSVGVGSQSYTATSSYDSY